MLGHAPRFEYLQEFRSQAGFDLVGAHLDDHAQRLHRDWKRTRGVGRRRAVGAKNYWDTTARIPPLGLTRFVRAVRVRRTFCRLAAL